MEQIKAEGGKLDARERFVQAVSLHGRSMYRAARALVGSDADAEDAEDAVGEAVLRAWSAYGGLKDPAALRAWLIKITVNCAYAQLRKSGRVTYMEDLTRVAGVVEPEEPCGLWEAVIRLPADQRAVVTLFYYEDMPVEEIAKVLGVAQGTVKSRLSRARARLKELLQEEDAI